MSTAEAFNRTAFSQFLNSRVGRWFRLAAGSVFLALGVAFRGRPLGIVSLVWGVLPFSAGALDVCYISAALGGPLAGAEIRAFQRSEPSSARGP